MTQPLTLKKLQDAVGGSAATFRTRTTLQPAGGEGDKVFPPTYAGGVYAVEKRRLPGRDEPVDCVLLDSVQSQANRMEEALQQAIDARRLTISVIVVDFSGNDLLSEVGRVTSLQAPHRIADAILRDSLLNGEPFRRSDEGRRIDSVSLANATPLYEMCPTALLFGMWDSAGPKGGLGAKFQRAIVSEIVGINAVFGVRTSSRIDPLQIVTAAGPLYQAKKDAHPAWTLDKKDAATDDKGNAVLYSRGGEAGKPGNPSKANHGNVTPSFTKYAKGAEGPDVLRRPDLSFDYRLESERQQFQTHQKFTSTWPEARQGSIASGGITIAAAEHMVTLSLPALRRLQFPLNGDKPESKVNDAGRTVLAALGLCAATLAAEKGFDLRSRCLLWPTEPLKWELLDRPGSSPESMSFDCDNAIELLREAVTAAENVGLRWRVEPLVLRPALQLLELVKRSQALTAAQQGDAEAAV